MTRGLSVKKVTQSFIVSEYIFLFPFNLLICYIAAKMSCFSLTLHSIHCLSLLAFSPNFTLELILLGQSES